MTSIESISVLPADWLAAASTLRAEGLTLLDLLAAVDRVKERELVVHIVDPSSGRRVVMSTRIPADDASVDSLAGVFAGASWYEREVAEMFGITFAGHPDPRPLLLHDVVAAPPLLTLTPLPARLATAWPAAVSDESGRRARRPQLPPGVRSQWEEVTS